MAIRRAEEKDIQRIRDLLLQVNNVHAEGRPDIFIMDCRKYNEEELREILQDPMRPIFAYIDENDVLQGYAFCEIQVTEAGGNLVPMKTIYIDDLCVDEACRGQHIGKALYTYVKEYAKEIGCYRVTLNVWYCNPKAMGFYENLGLRPLKKYMEEVL